MYLYLEKKKLTETTRDSLRHMKESQKFMDSYSTFRPQTVSTRSTSPASSFGYGDRIAFNHTKSTYVVTKELLEHQQGVGSPGPIYDTHREPGFNQLSYSFGDAHEYMGPIPKDYSLFLDVDDKHYPSAGAFDRQVNSMNRSSSAVTMCKATREKKNKQYERIWMKDNMGYGPNSDKYNPYPPIGSSNPIYPYHGNISIQPDKGVHVPKINNADMCSYEVLPGMGNKTYLSTQMNNPSIIISELPRPGPEIPHMLETPGMNKYRPEDDTNTIHRVLPRATMDNAPRDKSELKYEVHADHERSHKLGVRYYDVMKNTQSQPKILKERFAE